MLFICITGPSEAWGLGGLNNLLKFVDFETEKGCKSQGRRNKYSNSYIFEEALRIYQNAISFDVIEVKDFKIFRERLSLVVIFSSVISKNGAFSSDLKGVVMKNFSGGKHPDPHFSSLRSHLVSAPQYEIRSDGPALITFFAFMPPPLSKLLGPHLVLSKRPHHSAPFEEIIKPNYDSSRFPFLFCLRLL